MSLRLRLLNLFLRLAIKPQFRRLSDLPRTRRHWEFAARWLMPTAPPFTLTQPVYLGNGARALSIMNRPAGKVQSKSPIILYLHGGGFLAGSPRTHAKMLARLSSLTGLEVIAPWYRLAPEHPFPAAFEDTRAAYAGLVAKGYNPGDIILGGDSAGGALALALLAQLCAENTPPRALFAFSPLTDMRFQGGSIVENASRDPMLPSSKNDHILEMYLAGNSPEDPRTSPLLAGFSAPPPPVFLQYGESEILRDDSRRMADKLRQAGGSVTQDEWPSTPHIWVLFDGLVPEARTALKRTAAFIKQIS